MAFSRRMGGAVLLTATVVLAAGCAGTGPAAPPPAGEPGWEALPEAPLVPRLDAVTAWTGSEALFLGGDLGATCPEGAACDRQVVAARDGAAFDPSEGSWRRLADAPSPIEPQAAHAVVDDAVFVATQGRLLSYDASDDIWTDHPAPPGGLGYVRLATDGERVFAVRGERRAIDPPDHLYDPSTRTWTPVPEDPLGPGFDRMVTATAAGLVLTAHELVENPGADGPSFVRAAVLDPASLRWSRLPDSEQLGGGRWTWTGRRMLDPTPGGADGGEIGNYGRTIPFGGALDPASGGWAPLPDPPAAPSGGWPVQALGGPLAAVDGWLYDDRTEAWAELPRPQGAPPFPGSAVWAGDVLVVLHGSGGSDTSPDLATPVGGAWSYDISPDTAFEAPAPDVRGSWELLEGTSGGAELPLPPGGQATLVVEEDSLGGTAFCNGYGGEYDVEGRTLVLRGLGGTDMGCAPDLMAAEAAYLEVLRASRFDVRLEGEQLVLEADRGVLRFQPLPPVPVRELVGTRWALETLVTGEVASSTVGEPAVLELRDDGTVTGSTGCREFTGTWDTFGDEVRFPDFGSETVVECPAELAEQDGQVFSVLGDGFSVAIDGDVLTVTDRQGSSLVYRATA